MFLCNVTHGRYFPPKMYKIPPKVYDPVTLKSFHKHRAVIWCVCGIQRWVTLLSKYHQRLCYAAEIVSTSNWGHPPPCTEASSSTLYVSHVYILQTRKEGWKHQITGFMVPCSPRLAYQNLQEDTFPTFPLTHTNTPLHARTNSHTHTTVYYAFLHCPLFHLKWRQCGCWNVYSDETCLSMQGLGLVLVDQDHHPGRMPGRFCLHVYRAASVVITRDGRREERGRER